MVNSICKWNEERGNRTFDGSLEFSMLSEELQEFAEAYLKTIDDKFPKDTLTFNEDGDLSKEDIEKITSWINSEDGVTDYKVNQLDALADIVFVAIGSMYKLLGSADLVESVLDAVVFANNRKGKVKVNGKIQKPTDFVGPEEDIKELYLDRITLI